MSNYDLGQVRKNLDAIISKGHHGYSVFEDWIGLMFFAFQRDDPKYLEIMGKYRNTEPMGKRPADYFAGATASVMRYMRATNEESLSTLYEEYAANHYAGQFFTPPSVAQMMAKIVQKKPPKTGRFLINDPACGAGICLVSAAKEQTFEENSRAIFVGQDVDLNCARMTALNLMFFNLDGVIIWGNTLSLEVRGAWVTERSLLWGGSIKPWDKDKAKQWMCGHFQQQESNAPKDGEKISGKKSRKLQQLSLI